VVIGTWYGLWLQEIGHQEEAAPQLKEQNCSLAGRELGLDLSLLLLFDFLLAITLAKTEDKETQLMQFIKVSLLVCRAGDKKKEKALTGQQYCAGYFMCMMSLKLMLLWG